MAKGKVAHQNKRICMKISNLFLSPIKGVHISVVLNIMTFIPPYLLASHVNLGSFHSYQMKEKIMHYSDVIISAMASQITGVSIVWWTVCSGADQRKHQSFGSLAFVRGIHRCSRTKSQLYRKCLHLMTSSYVLHLCSNSYHIIHFNIMMRPDQNGRHIADDICKCIFLKEKSLRFIVLRSLFLRVQLKMKI